ncbi:hypothetical protein I41_39850 [Lacipirellula limnantheis]|uniref:Uncharacterized protein n=1 Tax=Lacipirellula limnantheis TaxID=2528024 RepID=A0A517U2E7_9BACT|nr:hypothetical protein I41_39850 [Lacipirellula limnantheis]
MPDVRRCCCPYPKESRGPLQADVSAATALMNDTL